MIGQCVTCTEQIDRSLGRKFCAKCVKYRKNIAFRVANQKRSGRNKIQYTCLVCDTMFFSTSRRTRMICNKNKCRNYLKNLDKKIQRIRNGILKSDERKTLMYNQLVANEIEYEKFLLKVTVKSDAL